MARPELVAPGDPDYECPGVGSMVKVRLSFPPNASGYRHDDDQHRYLGETPWAEVLDGRDGLGRIYAELANCPAFADLHGYRLGDRVRFEMVPNPAGMPFWTPCNPT